MCSVDTVTLTLIDIDDYDLPFYLLIVPNLKSFNPVIFLFIPQTPFHYIFVILK